MVNGKIPFKDRDRINKEVGWEWNSTMSKRKKVCAEVENMINTKRKSGPTNIEKILYNGSLYTDNNDISNKMNDHFCTIGNRLKSKLPQRNEDDFKKYLPPAILNSFCLREVLFEEVWKEINALKTKNGSSNYNRYVPDFKAFHHQYYR